MRDNSRQDGFALVLVIAVFLLLSMVGLVFAYIVRSKLESETERLLHAQSRYMAKSALQWALLEMQPRTELRTNARKGETRIAVQSPQDLPTAGAIAIGEQKPLPVFSYNKMTGTGSLNLNSPLSKNVPAGAVVYLLRDLDGDGKFGSIASRSYESGTIETISPLAPLETSGFPPSLLLRSTATAASTQTELESVVVFP